MAEFAPGFAISPDGRQLAVVHADREAVTLIDSERLAVERAIRLSRPTSLGDRLLQLLPLAPRGAAAKEPAEGAWLQAAYGVDGDRVYVWGIESTVDDAGRWDYYGSGLSVVDLTVGTVAAEVLLRTEVHGVWPSPDGASIYVVGYDEPRSLDAGANVFPLFRLDAATLATFAKREFSAPRWLVLQPRASDDASMHEPGT